MIVVFDAQCLLCNGWVQFILRHDRDGRIRFASMQGATGRQLLADAGLQVDSLQTLLVIDGARSWQHTAAILRVLHALGWPWRLAWVGGARAAARCALPRVGAQPLSDLGAVGCLHGAVAGDGCAFSGLTQGRCWAAKNAGMGTCFRRAVRVGLVDGRSALASTGSARTDGAQVSEMRGLTIKNDSY